MGPPNCLGDGRHGARSEFPIPTPRRGLVVEVAPNVVDMSAVALPGSPHVVTNVESDMMARVQRVPASDRWIR